MSQVCHLKANCQVISMLVKPSLSMSLTGRAELWVRPTTTQTPRVRLEQPTTTGTK